MENFNYKRIMQSFFFLLLICHMSSSFASEITMIEIKEPSSMCLELNTLFINFEVLMAKEKKAIKQFEDSPIIEDSCADIKMNTELKSKEVKECLEQIKPFVITGKQLLSEYKVLISGFKKFLKNHEKELSGVPLGVLNLKELGEDISDLVPEDMSELVKNGHLFLSARLDEVLSFPSSQLRSSFDSLKIKTIANYYDLATQLLIVDYNEELRSDYNSFFGTDTIIDFEPDDSEYDLGIEPLDSDIGMTKEESLSDLSELVALSDLKLLFNDQCL